MCPMDKNIIGEEAMNNKLDLSGEWISTFIDNNKIYNEKVKFKQTDNRLTANIILNFDGEMCEYKFNGIINKNIINGTYEYDKDSEVESGTISLKIINENFLYGVTTYLSSDKDSDDIVQSPYALFRNTKNNLGTFDLCSNCVGNATNCCANTNVDAPMILPSEAKAISEKMNIGKEEFANKIEFSKMYNDSTLKDLYQLKKQKDNACYFYRDNKCTIYDIRPIDCRIFPYDVKLEKDGQYYLVYYKTETCPIHDADIKDIKMVSYNTRLFLRMLLPYLREWADKYCCKILTKNNDYETICKIEDLF